MTLLNWLGQLLEPAVTPEAIRLEIFLLGSRHQGEALRGAIEELQAGGLTRSRSRLLFAAVDQLAARKPTRRPTAGGESPPPAAVD